MPIWIQSSGMFYTVLTLRMDKTDVTLSSTLNSIPPASGHSGDLGHYRAQLITP